MKTRINETNLIELKNFSKRLYFYYKDFLIFITLSYLFCLIVIPNDWLMVNLLFSILILFVILANTKRVENLLINFELTEGKPLLRIIERNELIEYDGKNNYIFFFI